MTMRHPKTFEIESELIELKGLADGLFLTLAHLQGRLLPEMESDERRALNAILPLARALDARLDQAHEQIMDLVNET